MDLPFHRCLKAQSLGQKTEYTHWAWDTLKGNSGRIIQSFMKSPRIVGNKNLFGHWNLLPGVPHNPLITVEDYQQ